MKGFRASEPPTFNLRGMSGPLESASIGLRPFSTANQATTMKLVKIAALLAAAAGSFFASSCCPSKAAPAPASPTYVAPAK